MSRSLPTSRSFHRPPPSPVPPQAPPFTPAQALLALPAVLALLVACYALELLPLELLLLGRIIQRKMSFLFSWIFGGKKAPGETAAGAGWDAEQCRKRAEEIARYDSLIPREAPMTKGYHPGIVNMSGTFCFLNSILQVLASSPLFLEYAHATLSAAVALPASSSPPSTSSSSPPKTAATDALLPFLLSLSTPAPSPHPRPLRPSALVDALRASDTFLKAGMFGRLREQQDAHELWALLSSAVQEESANVALAAARARDGLKGLARAAEEEDAGDGKLEEPWMGRMAYRRACRICGYSEGIRLMQAGEVSLSLPERTSSTTLERLLQQVTALETLTDSQCRKCRILKTHASLKATLLAATLPPAAPKAVNGSAFAALALADEKDEEGRLTASKKKRLRAERREAEREKERLEEVERLIAEGRWEDDVEGVLWTLVDGGVSTRQEMFSTPPPLLTIHLNRSSYSSSHAFKNPCHVSFPAHLDLSPLCTTGELSLDPTLPISSAKEGGTLAAVREGGAVDRADYSLVGFVNHLGGHSSGHYITYRRLPFTDRWLRISDDDVLELPVGGGEEVWKWGGRGEVVLLFYERAQTQRSRGTGSLGRVVRPAAGGMYDARTSSTAPTPGPLADDQASHRVDAIKPASVNPTAPISSPSSPTLSSGLGPSHPIPPFGTPDAAAAEADDAVAEDQEGRVEGEDERARRARRKRKARKK